MGQVTFCMHLGAKEISVDQIDLRTASHKVSMLAATQKRSCVWRA